MLKLVIQIITALIFILLPVKAAFVTNVMKNYPAGMSYHTLTMTIAPPYCPRKKFDLISVKHMLYQQALSMRPAVINKVLQTLKCADEFAVKHRPTLTVIDYSLSSNQKRLWVFDLDKKTLLFNTYVSHGIKSGIKSSDFFSNQNNSKASSIGVFKTGNAYYGRHGLALRLVGMERQFNNNASRRAIVMHGGWYVEERFIQKYGRAGRSWGCPAIPLKKTKSLINTIKNNSFFVAYYPSEKWSLTSKYLHCDRFTSIPEAVLETTDTPVDEQRQDILFVEKNHNGVKDSNEPVIVMSADEYIDTFKTKAPLKRMLRRQIKQKEYIALSSEELEQIIHTIPEFQPDRQKRIIDKIAFAIPDVKYHQGRYLRTDMKLISLGDIQKIESLAKIMPDMMQKAQGYAVHFKTMPSVQLQKTEQFIRWLGL